MSAATRARANTSAAATFHDHLKELRSRLFGVVAIFIIAASVAFSYKDVLLAVLMRPLDGEKLIYLTPAGGFSFIFQVSMYVGLIAAVPVLIYNLFRFIAPVLSKRTRMGSVAVMLSSIVLLAMGVGFGYFYAIPAAMQFLIHFADGFVSASLTAEAYLGFVMAYTAGLGLLFQLPLIIMFVHWIKPLSPLGLLKFERYMILLAFVAAAIISPTPDALNQAILAAPIIVMYQLGVIGVWISLRRKNKRASIAAVKETKAMRRAQRQRPAKAPVVTQSAAIPLAHVKRTGEAYATPAIAKLQPATSPTTVKPTPRMSEILPAKVKTTQLARSGVARSVSAPIDGVVKVVPKRASLPKVMSGVLPPSDTGAVRGPQARPGSYGAGSVTAPAPRLGHVIDSVMVRPRREAVQVPPARRSQPQRAMGSLQAGRSMDSIMSVPKSLDDSLL